MLRNGALPGAPQRQEGAETLWGTPALWMPQAGTAHSCCQGGAWALSPPHSRQSHPPAHESPLSGGSLPSLWGRHQSGAWAGSVPRLSLLRARSGEAERVAGWCGAVESGQGGGLCEGERARRGGEAMERLSEEPSLAGQGAAPWAPPHRRGLAPDV